MKLAYEVQYRFYSIVKSFGVFLAYSRKIQGTKCNKRQRLAKIGHRIETFSSRNIQNLIEKYFGYQDSMGWEGSALDGINGEEAANYINKQLSKFKKLK